MKFPRINLDLVLPIVTKRKEVIKNGALFKKEDRLGSGMETTNFWLTGKMMANLYEIFLMTGVNYAHAHRAWTIIIIQE